MLNALLHSSSIYTTSSRAKPATISAVAVASRGRLVHPAKWLWLPMSHISCSTVRQRLAFSQALRAALKPTSVLTSGWRKTPQACFRPSGPSGQQHRLMKPRCLCKSIAGKATSKANAACDTGFLLKIQLICTNSKPDTRCARLPLNSSNTGTHCSTTTHLVSLNLCQCAGLICSPGKHRTVGIDIFIAGLLRDLHPVEQLQSYIPSSTALAR